MVWNMGFVGEAQFINDMRPEFNELHGVFVLATVAKSSIKSIDASRALVSVTFRYDRVNVHR